MALIPRTEGRTAFGESPADYDRYRPAYPIWVYDELVTRCGLQGGTATFEIGPGSGVATRELLRLGAHPLIAIESDARFANHLKETIPGIQIQNCAFEDVKLSLGAFDLGVAATSMHWLEEANALAKVSQLLKPGGHWACWWNSFGDNEREDPFHEATNWIMCPLQDSPSSGERGIPYALDREARLEALRKSDAFDQIHCRLESWTLTLNTQQTRGLYATYSHITRLPQDEKNQVLDDLAKVAEMEFGGVVQRNMVTALYTARRIWSIKRDLNWAVNERFSPGAN